MALATGQVNIINLRESVTIVFSKESHVFAGGVTSALAGATDIVVSVLIGNTAVDFTIGTITGLPASGMSKTVSAVAGTKSQKINIAVTTLLTEASGVLSIPITIKGIEFIKNFSFSVSFKGSDGFAVFLSNDSVVIPTDAKGNNPVLGSANTSVSVYEGSVAKTPTIGTLTSVGCSATKSSSTVTITSLSAESGYVDIPVSVGATNLGVKRFSFSKARRGEATPSLSLEVPDGNVFKGNSGSPKNVVVRLYMGETEVTGSSTIKWYFNGAENVSMSGLTSIQVYPADVPGSLSIKVTATYDSITYQDSVTFLDVDDSYQVTISGKDKIKNSSENVVLTAIVFRGSSEITEGFRCRWSDISTTPATVLYEGINTTGTLAERGVVFTLTPAQINDKIDILCELSVDTVEQSLEMTEEVYVPNYDSKAYAAAMSAALS